MMWNALTDLRRLLNDFTGLDYTDTSLRRAMNYAATDISRRGLVVQRQEVIDLSVGVDSYSLPTAWIQTFAILHEDIQSYITLRDQGGGTWYLYMDGLTGETTLTNTLPAGVNVAPGQSFYWLRWTSPGATNYYVFPALLADGSVELSISDTQPAVGTGTTQTLELRSRFRIPWFLSVTNIPEVRREPFSSTVAQLRAPDPDATALILVTPEALQRLDPHLTSGPPRYATVWQGRLWVYPVPDARYQLDHKYFAVADTSIQAGYTLPQAFEQLPVFGGFAQALRGEGKVAHGQAVQAMYHHLLGYLSSVYSPVEQDSRDESRVPARRER